MMSSGQSQGNNSTFAAYRRFTALKAAILVPELTVIPAQAGIQQVEDNGNFTGFPPARE